MGWGDGYPTGSDYTYGYFRPLNPVFARFVLTVAGVAAPKIRTACELGYGQGVSVALHAAASDVAWWGTDFMPGQAAHARALVSDGVSDGAGGPVLEEQSFVEFCGRDDLPMFDFVCAHGIWSWVSEKNRGVIVDFLRRKLRPGGVFHVSHNTEVGWAGLRPFRELLLRHTEVESAASADPVAALRDAAGFAQRVLGAQSVYARQNPLAVAAVDGLADAVGVYHTHEYLGSHWAPMNVADVEAALGEAKLGYGCSARVLDQVETLALLPEHRAVMRGVRDAGLRETVREVLCGTRFRRDYWVKGVRRLGAAEHSEAVAALRVALEVAPDDVTEVWADTHVGRVALPVAAFRPVLEALGDFGAHGLGALAEAVAGAGMSAEDVLQSVLVLVDLGIVQPAQDAGAAAAAEPGVAALNGRLLERARLGGEIGYLASAVTGGGTEVPRVQQLMLLAEREGADAAEQAAYAASVMGVAGVGGAPGAGRREVLRRQGVA